MACRGFVIIEIISRNRCFIFSNENLRISLISFAIWFVGPRLGTRAATFRTVNCLFVEKKEEQKHFLFDLKQVKNDSGFRDKHINYYYSVKKGVHEVRNPSFVSSYGVKFASYNLDQLIKLYQIGMMADSDMGRFSLHRPVFDAYV